jgi:hypothetical protein
LGVCISWRAPSKLVSRHIARATMMPFSISIRISRIESGKGKERTPSRTDNIGLRMRVPHSTPTEYCKHSSGRLPRRS